MDLPESGINYAIFYKLIGSLNSFLMEGLLTIMAMDGKY